MSQHTHTHTWTWQLIDYIVNPRFVVVTALNLGNTGMNKLPSDIARAVQWLVRALKALSREWGRLIGITTPVNNVQWRRTLSTQ